MKLLEPKEIKQKKAEEIDKANQIANYLSKRTKELNDFKVEIEEKKKKILADFVHFAKGIADERSQLENGISTTEEKKTAAFNSLVRLSVTAETKYREAQENEAKTAEKERNLHEREEKLKEKSKVVDDREVMLNTRAKRLSDREDLIEVGEKTLERLKETTLADFASREKRIKAGEKVIDDRLVELNLSAEANIKTAQILEDRKRDFEKKMIEENRKLADGRATLERGFAELRNKQK